MAMPCPRPFHRMLRRAIWASALVSMAMVVCSPLTASAAEPAPDSAAWLFDPSGVVEIDLDLPQASIDALELDPDEYQPATFTMEAGGVSYGPLGVGARLKGGLGSFRPLSGKAAFKVKFDEYVDDQTFFGLEKLTLNNMVQDPSMVHEVLAYEAFRAVGVAAPRTGYAYVRVNGEDYGLYLNVETFDEVSLPRWFGSTQHLYEGAYGVDVTPGSAGAFEVDEGKGSKHEDLEALIAAASAKGEDWPDGIDAVADLPQMTRMWAVERYVGHWDGYAGLPEPAHLKPNNYYLHSDGAGVFRMLPWGTDHTWGERIPFGAESGGLLFNACLADSSCAALYRDALVEAQASIAVLDLDARVSELAVLLAPWEALDPRLEYTLDDVENAVQAARAFISARPGELAEWLNPPTGKPASPLPPPALAPGLEVPKAESRSLWIGTPRLLGLAVVTRLNLPEAGQVVQRVTAQIGDRPLTACVARRSRDRVGALTVGCRLSAPSRRRLASGPLAMTVSIGFTPIGGSTGFATRRITAAKR